MKRELDRPRRDQQARPVPDTVALEKALAVLAADLRELADAARELPGEETAALAEEDSFQRARQEIELQLLGAGALLTRRDLGAAAATVVSLRVDAARDALAALIVSSFGYYALPAPDPLLIDNEGPIGHHRALELMGRYAGRLEPAAVAAGGGAQHDQKRRLARQLFAPGDAPEDSTE